MERDVGSSEPTEDGTDGGPGRRWWLHLLAVAGALFGYVRFLRPRLLRWGATDEEATRSLPGDDLPSDPLAVSTRAVTVEAPPEDVWPWLRQLGQGRGGFYSYSWLENLAGAGIRNLDRIEPAYQELEVGDTIRMVRADYPYRSPTTSLTVARIDEGRTLVLQGIDGGTWTFHLEPLGDDATRLLVRSRNVRPRRLRGLVAFHVLYELPHFVMERGMLRGVKERAERRRERGRDGDRPRTTGTRTA